MPNTPTPVTRSTLSKRPALPTATYSAADTFGLFGIGYTAGMEQVKAGTFPVVPIKCGRVYRFAKATVDRMLGLDSER